MAFPNNHRAGKRFLTENSGNRITVGYEQSLGTSGWQRMESRPAEGPGSIFHWAFTFKGHGQ